MCASLHMNKTGVVILSGGHSSRMKTHKALLMFSTERSFIQQIASVYHGAGVNGTVVVRNAGIAVQDFGLNESGVTMVENSYPDKGRLYSLQLGLAALGGAEYCFIQNVDNPFVNQHTLSAMYSERNRADYVKPLCQGLGGHPVLLSRSVMDAVLGCHDISLTLRDILAGFSKHEVSADETCLVNINDRSDYEKFFADNDHKWEES